MKRTLFNYVMIRVFNSFMSKKILCNADFHTFKWYSKKKRKNNYIPPYAKCIYCKIKFGGMFSKD